MVDLRTLNRPLLAASFVFGGWHVLRNPAPMTPAAESVGVPIAGLVGLPTDPVKLVKINAGVQLGAGLALAFGILPRAASLALAASLVPTTVGGHRFWEQRDPQLRRTELIAFLKNAGMLGGLLTAALDTGGRPSVFWSGRRAAVHASKQLSQAASTVGDTMSQATNAVADTLGSAVHALPGVAA